MTIPREVLSPQEQPGSSRMPPWNVGELIDAPRFGPRNVLQMLGPGLVMGAAAIGGGEWLSGPAVTAKYGPALLWVATISILFQVVYNIEICRYTLYTGEPIFSGKLRIAPSPWFWVIAYLILDWGSVFPYLATNAAVPLQTILWGRLPDAARYPEDVWIKSALSTLLLVLSLIPLLVGGKVYNSLKVVMTLKLVLIMGFLLLLGVFFTRPSTWWEITRGMFEFGTIPVLCEEDKNGNGTLDPGEDFDGDGKLDSIEPVIRDEKQQIVGFDDQDGDGIRDGVNVENIWNCWREGRQFPPIDLSMIAVIAGLAAIAGNGGLTNTPISNFTRDQGWGMGYQVGAIASIVGGQGISLSHVGCVFRLTDESLRRWRRWMWQLRREQICVWMLACLVGVSLPSVLSVEFLPRGTEAKDWSGAAMTADGVRQHVVTPRPDVLVSQAGWKPVLATPQFGNAMWTATLFCGFLVLISSHITTTDGFVRRWVDVVWTASPTMHKLRDDRVSYVYFTILLAVGCVSLVLTWVTGSPGFLFQLCTTGYNYAFAFSAWHTIAVNNTLLPKPLRPGWFTNALMVIAGLFYSSLGVVATLKLLKVIAS